MTTEGLATSGASMPDSLLPITVHGPTGALDVMVPGQAQVMDVAREYAAQAGVSAMPILHDRLGRALSPTAVLDDLGVSAGDLLVATLGVHRPRAADQPTGLVTHTGAPGPVSVLWLSIAAAAAVLSGWFATGRADTDAGRFTCLGLAVIGVLGVVPLGRLSPLRSIAAPAFGAAAALAWFWPDSAAELPGVVGLAGLAAALLAGLGRALTPYAAEALAVWIAAGLLCFVLGAASSLFGLPSSVIWCVLLVLAMLATRLAPTYAVEVPDDYLLDLERLAVTAWSARARPAGRRGRIVVQETYVAGVAERGSRLLTAISAAVAVLATVAAYALVPASPLPIDRIGVRVLIVCVAAALLLAARTYRHPVARRFLRLGGLGVASSLLPQAAQLAESHPVLSMLAVLGLATAALTSAVAFGRGWRSAWWARRAEVAESLVGAFALASVVVATGAFRLIWEAVSVRN